MLDASEESQGVTAGMLLSQAQSRCPEAIVIRANPPLYQEAWNNILEALEQLCSAVEDGGVGCAYGDIGGLASFYRGEDRLARALLSAAPTNWGAHIGIALSRFSAYLAATTSPPGRWSQVPVDVATYLAPFPMDVLPLPQQVIGRFHSFGLHTLGQIATLPFNGLQAQFGSQGKLAWELANGIDRRPLSPRRPQTVVRETAIFPSPVTTIEALLIAIENLLGKAFSRTGLRGRCARVALLEAEIAGAPPSTKRITFKEPVAGKEKAHLVFKKLLGDLRLPGPVESLSLTLSGIGGEAGRQASLFSDVRQRDNLHEALRELEARFGTVPMYLVREVEPWSRIPERRRALVPYAL